MAEIRVPTLGESVTEATIGKWFKKPGDAVAVDEPLVELETDKVTIEVPAPAAGVLARDRRQGRRDGRGRRAARPDQGGRRRAGKAGRADRQPTEDRAPTPISAAARSRSRAPRRRRAKSRPATRRSRPRCARSRPKPASIPPRSHGSGKDGRVTKGDMMAAIERAAAAPTPVPQTAAAVQVRAPSPADDAAREERVKMTRLRQTIARRLKEAQNTAAMLTTFNEVDMSAVMHLRNQYKDQFEKKPRREARLHGLLRARLRAGAEGNPRRQRRDRRHRPHLQELLSHRRRGRHREGPGRAGGARLPTSKSLAEIEKTIADFGRRARDGALKIEEMQGGTFTISNGGVYGSLMSTPILNAPQSGILGMHKIQERPMVVAGKIEIRPMMYLALSYDHRIVDGREAVTFLVRVKDVLEDPARLVLDL